MEAQENKDIVAEIKRILGKEWVEMPKKTVTIDVDENLLVVANNEISELLYEYDSELMSDDENGDYRDIEEKRDALKHAVQIIDKLTWGD